MDGIDDSVIGAAVMLAASFGTEWLMQLVQMVTHINNPLVVQAVWKLVQSLLGHVDPVACQVVRVVCAQRTATLVQLAQNDADKDFLTELSFHGHTSEVSLGPPS